MSHNKITWKLKNLMRMRNYEESTGAGCDKGHRDMMCYRSDRSQPCEYDLWSRSCEYLILTRKYHNSDIVYV